MAQKHLQLLRNGSAYGSYQLAYNALTGMTSYADGTPILARYSGTTGEIKTLLGVVNNAEGVGARVDIINDVQASILRAYNLEDATSGAIATNDSIEVALNKLENQVKSAKAAATTKVEKDADASHLTLTSSAATDGSVTYTIGESDIASKTDLDAEIAARKAVDGQNGQTYTANSDANYISGVDSLNAADVALDTAVASLSGKVDNLDFTLAKDDNKVVVSLSQTDGQVGGTSELITSVKLSGYTEGTDADIAASDTLGEALGKLQAQINAMDKTDSAVDGQVVTTVAEEDGKVTETKANVKDLQLGGYSKTSDSGAISGTDTVNVALSKLENNIAAAQSATTVDSSGHTINVTTAASGTNIDVNVKSGEHVIATTGDGLYTDIKLSGVTPSSTTVKEEYSLVATDGTVLGENIKIYKDSHISAITYITDSADAHYQNLKYDYIDVNGSGRTEYVDMSKLVIETEFASGVTADASGVVHGVVDQTSESFLTVGADGFKLYGVQNAIDDAIKALDVTGDTAVAGQYITHINETDGKIQIGGREDIANAPLNGYSKGTAPASLPVTATDTVNEAIAKLEHQVDAAKAAATTVVEHNTANTHVTVSSSPASDGHTVYTVNEDDIASATALTAEIAARKAVDGVNGDAYTADTNAHYISGTSNLYAADQALDTALYNESTARTAAIQALDAEKSGATDHVSVKVTEVDGVITDVTVTETDIASETDLDALSGKTVTLIESSNNSISASTAATADGTVKYDLTTDGAKVMLTGYDDTVTGTPASGDSVNSAIAKLYNKIDSIEVEPGSATTVVPTSTGQKVDVKLDTTSTIAEYDADHAQAVNETSKNVLEITANGLYLNNNWDCGTYDEPAGN